LGVKPNFAALFIVWYGRLFTLVSLLGMRSRILAGLRRALPLIKKPQKISFRAQVLGTTK
jgi:hypothetical protein